MRSSTQNRQPSTYNIELVDKLVRVLEVLRDAPAGLTLQDLTERTGYIKSSIHRTLGSLKWHGYVEQPMVTLGADIEGSRRLAGLHPGGHGEATIDVATVAVG